MARTLPPKKKAAAPGAPNGSEGNTDMPAALRIAAGQPNPSSDEAHCPVAALASRAAKLLRAYYSLVEPDCRLDPKPYPEPPIPVPNLYDIAHEDTDMSVYQIRDNIISQINAISNFAAFEVAKSRKGALFQLYLAANTARDLTGHLLENNIKDEEWSTITKSQERSQMLIYNALFAIEGDPDEDLKLLRCWFFNPEWFALTPAIRAIARLDGERTL